MVQSENNPIEEIRQSFKPNKIKVLFIGESAPASGGFFYKGDTMCTHTKKAFSEVYPEIKEMDNLKFLDFFKENGFYLDDLCLIPVDKMGRAEKELNQLLSITLLAGRIKKYAPEVIISVGLGIKECIFKAIVLAGFENIPYYKLPFAGNSHQNKYVNQLSEILLCLNKPLLFY